MDEARMHHISHVKPAKTCMAKMDVQRELSIRLSNYGSYS